jgi:hypothetical protein
MKPAVVLTTLLLLAGCAGSNPGPNTGSEKQQTPSKPVNLVPDGYAGRFRVNATVLENANHGPQVCTMVADSLPPQCGGPDIAGWSWDGLQKESVNGTTWGSYTLIGKYDGKKFMLTEPAKAPDARVKPPTRDVDFTSPCTPPKGGWKPVDAAKSTDDAMQAVQGIVTNDPDYAGLWIDQDTPTMIDGTPASDPHKFVLNVKFTKDLARHEADIRKVWGGALCVSQARHTEAELRKIQDELSTEPGMSFASTDMISETVEIGVFVATASRQRELDAKYGPGLVNLVGTLEPID